MSFGFQNNILCMSRKLKIIVVVFFFLVQGRKGVLVRRGYLKSSNGVTSLEEAM